MRQHSSRNTKAKQYQFNLLIKEAEVEYSSTFNFKLLLKRGNKQIESKNNFKYEMSSRKIVEICEEMNLISTFTYNDDGSLKDKQYKLFLQVYTKTGFKNAAFTDINLLNFIDQGYTDVELEFKKHPFAYLRVKANVSSKFLMDVDLTNGFNDISRLSDNDDDLNISVASSRRQQEANTTHDSKSITEEVETKTIRKSIKISNQKVNDKVALTENLVGKKDDRQIEELNNKIDELNRTINTLQKENKELKAVGSKANVGVLDEDEKERIINELKTENDYYIDEIDQLKSIIADLKTEKTKIYEEKIKSIKALNEEMEKLKEIHSTNEKLNKKLTKEKSEFEDKLKVLEQTVNDLNTKIVHNE
jgi:hypothetical protein